MAQASQEHALNLSCSIPITPPGQNALQVPSYGKVNSTLARYNFNTTNQLNTNADGGYPVGVYIPGDVSDLPPTVYNDAHFGVTGTYTGSVYISSGTTMPNPGSPLFSGAFTGQRTTGAIWGGASAYSTYAQNSTITFTLEYQDPADGYLASLLPDGENEYCQRGDAQQQHRCPLSLLRHLAIVEPRAPAGKFISIRGPTVLRQRRQLILAGWNELGYISIVSAQFFIGFFI